MIDHLVPKEIRSLPAYDAGLSEKDVASTTTSRPIVKLSSNENPLGPSKLAIEAAQEYDRYFRYPDPNCSSLRKKLAQRNNIHESQLVFGNGSEDLINLSYRVLLRPGDKVVTVRPSFQLHETYATALGASVVHANFSDDLTFDVDAIAKEMHRGCNLLALSTPSNPVGTTLSLDGIGNLCLSLPEDAVFLIDLAYFEYVEDGEYDNIFDVLKQHCKLFIILRTFSKAFGLAGLRVGYGIVSHPDLAAYIDRIRTPFNVNSVAISAATAALDDPEHVRKCVEYALRERKKMTKALSRHDYWVAESRGNFVFVDVNRNSKEFAEELVEHGVIVKPWSEPGFGNYIRVSVGTVEENNKFLSAIEHMGDNNRSLVTFPA